MSCFYRRIVTVDDLAATPNAALERGDMLTLACPCGLRHVHLRRPPHDWRFIAEDDHALDLTGSVGYRATEHPPRPENWCHFSVIGGDAAMHSDAKCPGRTGEIS